MRVIRRDFYNVARPDIYTIIPIGDVHIGAAACDEKRFTEMVGRIASDPQAYWVGMGDMCECITRADKRFEPDLLANWIELSDLVDIAKAQRDRFLDIIKPISDKCLGLVEGNHEHAIRARYERDIYSEIVTTVKEWAGLPADQQLALGFYGWLITSFYRADEGKRQRCTRYQFCLHHGFVGGKLKGAKALNMERWLWTHDCDVAIFGHSHNTDAMTVAVEALDKNGNLITKTRRGCFSGSFLQTTNSGGPSTYSERKGYFPLPVMGCEIVLRPGADTEQDRVHIVV